MKLVLIGGGNYGTYPEQPYNLKKIDEKVALLSGKADFYTFFWTLLI